MPRCYSCNDRFDTYEELDAHFVIQVLCEDCEDNLSLCPTLDAQPWIEEHNRDYHAPRIYGWDFRPAFQPRGTEKNWYLGLELEITDHTENPAAIYEWAESAGESGLFYVKHDGSVNGFEIVTHPMTPGFFRGFNWEGFFDMLNEAYDSGRREPQGHGLHVHISRSAFPQLSSLAAYHYFLMRNKSRVAKMARRTETQWARWSQTPVRDVLPWLGDETIEEYVSEQCNLGHDHGRYEYRPNPRVRWHGNGIRQNRDRYRVLNLTNQDTVEFRLPRSTRNPLFFRRTVEFVASSVDYVATLSRKHADTLSWDGYMSYVSNDPYLSNLIVISE